MSTEEKTAVWIMVLAILAFFGAFIYSMRSSTQTYQAPTDQVLPPAPVEPTIVPADIPETKG